MSGRWTPRGDIAFARKIDRAADALYAAIKDARKAGLKVWIDLTDHDDGQISIDFDVSRPIPLPNSNGEAP